MDYTYTTKNEELQTHSLDQLSFGIPLQKKKKNVYCANCGEKGHVYKECNGPITSFGIIAFKIVKTRDDELFDLNFHLRTLLHDTYNDQEKSQSNNKNIPKTYPSIKFLLIQRKDTMGYIDFIRGKYPVEEPKKTEMLKTYLKEMTISERESLRTLSFEDLWYKLWVNKESKTFRNEYDGAKDKYSKLDVIGLLDATSSTWKHTEWGLPKGRKNLKEGAFECAEREFREETGYMRRDYSYVQSYPTIEETFVGTNGVPYRHVYYLVQMRDNTHSPVVDKTNVLQAGEVQNIGWYTLGDCLMLLRPYDVAKKDVLMTVHSDIRKYFMHSKPSNLSGSPPFSRSPTNHFNTMYDVLSPPRRRWSDLKRPK